MADIGLQLQNTIADYIAVGGAVLFNETLVNDDPNVVYNPADGTISFVQEGEYYVSWFVVTKTGLGTSGPSFSIVTNEATPTYLYGWKRYKNRRDIRFCTSQCKCRI